MDSVAGTGTSFRADEARPAWRDVAELWALVGPTAGRAGLVGRILLMALVIAANTWGQVRLNQWQGAFYDAIGRRDLAAFWHQLAVFATVVSALLLLVVAQTWLVEHVKVRLRGLLTRALLTAWLAPRRAYLLQYRPDVGGHPDQRIHEDVRHLSELAADLGSGLIQAALLLVSFVGVLWQLSAGMQVNFAGGAWTIPGFMVWFALAYSLAGSFLTSWVGRPLVRLNAERYSREADLRFALVRIDESAQSIALHRREHEELQRSGLAFDAVQATGARLANALARLTFITSAYGWGALVAPVLAAMPAYFSGSLSLGGLMMVIGAFGQVQQALRWSVDNFSRIADGYATLRRVCALHDALAALSAPAVGPHVVVEPSTDGALSIEALQLDLPDGIATLDEDHLAIAPGDHVLVSAPRGTGKSILFLALAGLWTRGTGTIRLPMSDDILYMPERPRLTAGRLRDVLSPSDGTAAPEATAEALDQVGLSHLIAQLDREGQWDRDLHVEEQQGLALARLLLQRPAWVIMDEALSSFRDVKRRRLLAVLAGSLPDTGFVATGSPDEVDGFWTRIVQLRKRPADADPARLGVARGACSVPPREATR